MKRWGIVSSVVGGIGAILIFAASVPFDEATGNLQSWLKPLSQEPAKPIIFWLGIALVVGAAILPIRKLMARINAHLVTINEDESQPIDHWADRQRLEIYILANVSAGQQPHHRPIVGDPELSRLRELKDAITAGTLSAELNGRNPNASSTVTLTEFEMYVAATNKPYWVELLQRWQKVQNPPADKLAEALKRKRIPLMTLLDCAREIDWDVLNPDLYDGFDLIHGLTEAAGLGDISLLGKPMDRHSSFLTKTGKLQRIPEEAWRNIEIDPISCFEWKAPGFIVGLKQDNAETATKFFTGNALAIQGYADLHVETEGLLDWLKNDAKSYRGHYAKNYGD